MTRLRHSMELNNSAMPTSRPEVSVVVAVKNEQVYIESAITSILNQSGTSLEVVAVDDGSTDNTFEILSRIAAQSPNLRLHRNIGCGKSSAFNYGVSQASGRFLCLFAGDDIMPAGSLAARCAMVRDCPDDIPAVGLCKLITMSDNKRFDGHVVPRRAGRGGFTGQSYLMNRAAVEKIFPVPEFLPNEDTWIELAVIYFDNWNVVHSDVIGSAWRVHDGNSINMFVDFDEYNRKITARMRAVSVFYERHGSELSDENRRKLGWRVECEARRAAGSVSGILMSRVNPIEKLRALSISNRFFYGVRRRLYGLLSGW